MNRSRSGGPVVITDVELNDEKWIDAMKEDAAIEEGLNKGAIEPEI